VSYNFKVLLQESVFLGAVHIIWHYHPSCRVL